MSVQTILKTILLIIGVLLTLNAFIVSFNSNYNAGILLIWICGPAVLLSGIFFDTLSRSPLFIRIILITGTSVASLMVAFWYIYGMNDTADYKEDAVIVLGAGIHGEEVSGTLSRRLDRAIGYYEENPDCVIVVSGGQGPQETISEALAMERYLLSKGIPSNKIIKEDKSTDTNENFRFSKQILDEYFEGEYSTVFITNDYHIFRAMLNASRAGFDSINHCHSSTAWYSVIPSGLREILGIGKYILTNLIS